MHPGEAFGGGFEPALDLDPVADRAQERQSAVRREPQQPRRGRPQLLPREDERPHRGQPRPHPFEFPAGLRLDPTGVPVLGGGAVAGGPRLPAVAAALSDLGALLLFPGLRLLHLPGRRNGLRLEFAGRAGEFQARGGEPLPLGLVVVPGQPAGGHRGFQAFPIAAHLPRLPLALPFLLPQAVAVSGTGLHFAPQALQQRREGLGALREAGALPLPGLHPGGEFPVLVGEAREPGRPGGGGALALGEHRFRPRLLAAGVPQAAGRFPERLGIRLALRPEAGEEPVEHPEADGAAVAFRFEGDLRGAALADPGVERFPAGRLLGDAEDADALGGLPGAPGGAGVPARLADAPVQFSEPVADALQGLLRGAQVRFALLAVQPVGAEPGGLLDQDPQILRAAGEHIVGAALFDERVGAGAESGGGEEALDIPAAGAAAVDPVGARPGAVHPAADDHGAALPDRGPAGPDLRCPGRLRFGDRPVAVGAVAVGVGVPAAGERSRRRRLDGADRGAGSPGGEAAEVRRGADQMHLHFGDSQRIAEAAAAEDQVLAPGADRGGAQLAEDPEHRVGDVALAAAVGADDRGGAALELQRDRVGETLEPGDLDPVDPHPGPHAGVPSSRFTRAGRDGVPAGDRGSRSPGIGIREEGFRRSRGHRRRLSPGVRTGVPGLPGTAGEAPAARRSDSIGRSANTTTSCGRGAPEPQDAVSGAVAAPDAGRPPPGPGERVASGGLPGPRAGNPPLPPPGTADSPEGAGQRRSPTAWAFSTATC